MADKMVLIELCKKGTGSTGEVVGKLLTYDVDTADDVDALVDSNYFGSTSGTRWNGINLITQKQCVSRGWFLVMPTNGRPVRYNKLSDVERFYDLGKGEVTIPVEGTMELLKNGTELVNNWIEYTGVGIDLSISNLGDKVAEWTSSDPNLFTVSTDGAVTADDITGKIGKVDIIANVDKTEFIANIVFNGVDLIQEGNTVKLSDYTVIGGRINNRSIRYAWFKDEDKDKPVNTTDTYDVAGEYTVKAYLPFVSNDKKITYEFITAELDVIITEEVEGTNS